MKFNKDMAIGAATILIAAFGAFIAIPYGIDVPSSVTVLALSPDFWPRIIMAVFAFCGAIVLIQGFITRDDSAENNTSTASEDEENSVDHHDFRGQTWRVLAALALLFAFYLAIPILGLVAGGMILVLVSTKCLGVKSWAKSLALAVILPLLLYVFFTQAAHIPIPLGYFEAWR